jgi:glycosyltransferase involved in cell wall biosynthesis
MKITVIICTYNRCVSLSKSLESLVASTLPPSVDWEVLIVDNNSTDQTKTVIERFCSCHPNLVRYVFEPQPGKSHALNTGILAASGTVLAFMDDDVTVESTWLQNLTMPLHDEQWAGSGGRILPQSAWSPPAWVPVTARYGLAPLAMFDLGLDAGPLTEPPFGTNMAFQKWVFEKYGGFRTDLGPRPGSEIRNEDTEFGQRLLTAGEQLRYEPSAVVYHTIPEARLRKPYFLAWWFAKGRADAREFKINTVRLHCSLAAWTLRWVLAFDPARRFERKLIVRWKAGALLERYRQVFATSGREEQTAET